MIRTTLALILVLVGSLSAARAEEMVTVVEPEGDGPGTASLAAELGAAIDEVLGRNTHLRRVTQNALLPGELRAAFGCLALDAECAGRAADAAGATLALFARIERRPDTLIVRLYLVEAPTGNPRRNHTRRLRMPDREAFDDARLRRIFRGLVSRLLDERPGGNASLYLAGDGGVIDGRAYAADTLLDVAPGRHRLRVGTTRATVDPRDGELLVVDAARLPGVVAATRGGDAAEGKRIAAWMTLGVGLTAGVSALWVSRGYRAAKTEYATADNGVELREARSRAQNLATITNVLIGTAVVAIGASTWLFLSDSKGEE